jgi:hypothetical protein
LEQRREEGRFVLGGEGGGRAEPVWSVGGEGGVSPEEGRGQAGALFGVFLQDFEETGSDGVRGAYDNVVRGKMIGGFGLVARPAVYGVTGVMAFMVNHDGVVFEKDLGKDTEKVVGAMKRFDPDKSWKKVESEGFPSNR